MMVHCPHCQQEHPEGTSFCPLTGKALAASYCPYCGKPVDSAWEYCGYCGQPITRAKGFQSAKRFAFPRWAVVGAVGLVMFGFFGAAVFLWRQFSPPARPQAAAPVAPAPDSQSISPAIQKTASSTRVEYAPTIAPGVIHPLTPMQSNSSTPINSLAADTPAPVLVPSLAASEPAGVSIKGAAVLSKIEGQLILYGRRAGADQEEVSVVDEKTLADVSVQIGIKEALSGRGPRLFAYLPDQKFTDGQGATALADVSIGSTENPDITIAFMWTSNIDGLLPAMKEPGALETAFSVNEAQAVEVEGWLQWGNVWLSDKNAASTASKVPYPFFLFHHDQEIYILGFLPGCQYTLPSADTKTAGSSAHSGQGYSYLLKGFKGGTVMLPIQGMMSMPVPVLLVTDLEKKSP
jgi:hypothetical protein